jgi:hypothetical protein
LAKFLQGSSIGRFPFFRSEGKVVGNCTPTPVHPGMARSLL